MASNRTDYGLPALVLAALTGGIIGATLGILFAPASGRETRRRIKDQSEETTERLMEAAEDLRERAEELKELSKDKFTVIQGKVQKSVEKIKEKIAPEKEKEWVSEE